MKNRVNLTRSETWLNADFEEISRILEDTIKDFIRNDRIINIEVKEKYGLERFWIYSESVPPTINK